MTDDSKKLTVSFGAFSCTLDGYDDPVPMLSQIVTYFQGIAKDDPDFGTVQFQHSEGAGAVGSVSDAADTPHNLATSANAPGDFDVPEAGTEEAWETFVVSEDAFPSLDDNEESDTAEETTGNGADEIAEVETQLDEEPLVADASLDTALALSDEAKEPQIEAQDTPLGEIEDTIFNLMTASNDPQTAPDFAQDDGEVAPGLFMEPADEALSEEASLKEEEAAIERMLSTSLEADPKAAELEPGNPLARLRKQADDAAEALSGFAEGPGPLPLRLDEPTDSTQSTTSPLRLDPLPLTPPTVEVEPQIEEPDVAALDVASDDAALADNAADKAEEAPAPSVLRLVPIGTAPVAANTPPLSQSAAPENTEEASGLREFAASMGAASLPELLEASAAYVTIVGGQTTFSRREIFDLFDTLNGENHVSFEARIKTLSRLLRTGVLERAEDGSFSMSHAARAQYEERASA